MFELENVRKNFATKIEKLFDGRLPDDPRTLAAGVVQCVQRMIPDAEPKALEELSNQMLFALSLRIAIERQSDAGN